MTTTDSTVPVRVVCAAGSVQIAKAMQQASQAAAAGQCALVAGIVFLSSYSPRQPHAWQFSLSHWGRPPIVVGIHRLRRTAEAQMARVQMMSCRHDVRDDAAVAALVGALTAFSDGEVE